MSYQLSVLRLLELFPTTQLIPFGPGVNSIEN